MPSSVAKSELSVVNTGTPELSVMVIVAVPYFELFIFTLVIVIDDDVKAACTPAPVAEDAAPLVHTTVQYPRGVVACTSDAYTCNADIIS